MGAERQTTAEVVSNLSLSNRYFDVLKLRDEDGGGVLTAFVGSGCPISVGERMSVSEAPILEQLDILPAGVTVRDRKAHIVVYGRSQTCEHCRMGGVRRIGESACPIYDPNMTVPSKLDLSINESGFWRRMANWLIGRE